MISAIRLPIVARLIGAEEIGTFGAALLILSLLDVLSQTGLTQAGVQRQGDVRPYYGTIWAVQAVRGLALGITLYLLGPAIASLFRTPEATPLLQVLAVVPIIVGLQATVQIHLQRLLRFGYITSLQTSASLIEAVVTVTVAWFERSAWSLVVGRLASVTFTLTASWILMPERRLMFTGLVWSRLRELRNFGFWIFASILIGFLLIRGGDFVIARMLDTTQLGYYQMATVVATVITLEVARVTNTIGFPLYSRIGNDQSRLRRAFTKAFLVLVVAVGGLTVVLTADPRSLTLLALGEDFLPAVGLMVPLTIWGACRATGAGHTSVLQAAGRPRDAMLSQLVMLILFAAGVIPAVRHFGMEGIAWLLAAVGTVVHLLRYEFIYRVVGGRRWPLYACILIPVAAMILGALAARGMLLVVGQANSVLRFSTCAVTGGIAYLVSLWILSRWSSLPVVASMLDVMPDRFRSKPPVRWVQRHLA